MATVQNIATTQTDISSHIYTNGNRLITAADVASVLQNMAVSYINRITDLPYLGLKAFSTTTTYAVGDCCVYLGVLYQCTTIHTGAWNAGDFSVVGGGALTLTTTGSSGAATLVSNTLNIPNYTANGLLPSQTGNSGKYLTTNGTTISWGTISAMTNPMTTQGDIIFGGASGTPTRLAIGTTGYILQAGATAPQWFNLFGTANTFTEAQSITKTQTTPLYGVVITNSNGGNAWTNTGAGVQLVSNAATASIEYNNSTGTTVNDKTIRYVSPNGHSFLAGGTTGNTAFNYYWECVSSASYMRLLQSASSPRTLLELFNSNGGSTYVELRLNAGSSPVSLIGKSASLGIGVSPTSTFHVAGSLALTYVAKTANYTATISDYLINCTANSFTVTLPTAVSIAGRVYEIVNSGAGTITIATTSSQTFTNVTGTPTTLSLIAALSKSIRVMSDGANWLQLN